jgi:ankyrin repeat protein
VIFNYSRKNIQTKENYMSKQQDFKISYLNNDLTNFEILVKDNSIDVSEMRDYPIRHACFNGNIEIVKLLLNNKKVNPLVDYNYPIKYAFQNGHTEVVKALWNDQRVKKTLIHDIPSLHEKLTKEEIKNKLSEF